MSSEPRTGTFYGISVGPGDPELLTRKAVRLLTECPVIAAPVTAGARMVALEIAQQAVDLSDKTVLSLRFVMDQDEEEREEAHRMAAQAVAEYLEMGMDVAMVSLGDVSVYSSTCYLLETLAEEGFHTEMVPGVPSFCAVAASLGMSLTQISEPLCIVPAGSAQLEECLKLAGTKVLMKNVTDRVETRNLLEREGLLADSCAVTDCGMPGETVYRSLEDMSGQEAYFTTFVVRGTAKGKDVPDGPDGE